MTISGHSHDDKNPHIWRYGTFDVPSGSWHFIEFDVELPLRGGRGCPFCRVAIDYPGDSALPPALPDAATPTRTEEAHHTDAAKASAEPAHDSDRSIVLLTCQLDYIEQLLRETSRPRAGHEDQLRALRVLLDEWLDEVTAHEYQVTIERENTDELDIDPLPAFFDGAEEPVEFFAKITRCGSHVRDLPAESLAGLFLTSLLSRYELNGIGEATEESSLHVLRAETLEHLAGEGLDGLKATLTDIFRSLKEAGEGLPPAI
ncbi:hypothetical protein [Nocardia gipuzkoensis]